MAVQMRYRVGVRGKPKTLTKRLALGKALERLRRRAAREAGPWVVWTHGKQGRAKFGNLDKAMDAVKRRAKRERPDYELDRIYLKSRSTGKVFVLQEAVPLAPKPPVGTCAVVRAHREVYGLWKGLESWGIYNCRAVAGTSTPSQHSYANAEDIHGVVEAMDFVANWLVANAARLKVATVIFNRRIWTAGTGAWRAYGGAHPHDDHVHVDFLPSRRGACKANVC